MQKETRNWLILILLALVWGSSFFLMKRGMKFPGDGSLIFSSTEVAALRMALAGIVLLPFGLKFFNKIKSVKTFLAILIVGFFGNFIPAFLYTYAETELSSGYTGMLTSFVPIFTLFIGYLAFKQNLTKMQMIGVLIGGAGVTWLMLSGGNLSSAGSWKHIFAVVGATFCYAISLNTIKNMLQGMKPMAITSLAFTFTLIPALLFSYFFGVVDTFTTNENAMFGFWHIFILAVVGTALAVIIFNYLIVNSTALFASSVTYFIPIVALFIGLLIGETISVYQIMAMLVVLLGVYVANYLGVKKKEI